MTNPNPATPNTPISTTTINTNPDPTSLVGPNTHISPNTDSLSNGPSIDPNPPLVITSSSNPAASSSQQPQSSLRQSFRAFHPHSYLSDYHYYSTSSTSQASSSKVLYPLSYVISYNNCSPAYHHFFVPFLLIMNLPFSNKLTNWIKIGSML